MSLSKQQKGGKDCLLDFSISKIFILQIFIHENIVDYTQTKMLRKPKTNNVINYTNRQQFKFVYQNPTRV